MSYIVRPLPLDTVLRLSLAVELVKKHPRALTLVNARGAELKESLRCPDALSPESQVEMLASQVGYDLLSEVSQHGWPEVHVTREVATLLQEVTQKALVTPAFGARSFAHLVVESLEWPESNPMLVREGGWRGHKASQLNSLCDRLGRMLVKASIARALESLSTSTTVG